MIIFDDTFHVSLAIRESEKCPVVCTSRVLKVADIDTVSTCLVFGRYCIIK